MKMIEVLKEKVKKKIPYRNPGKHKQTIGGNKLTP